ncbi:DUF2156 domain-containing protein [Fusibacter bizertensis]
MKAFNVEAISILKPYYRQFHSRVSDISLTNLVIWNSKYGFCYKIIEDCLFIIIELSDGSLCYSMPIGHDKEENLKAIDYLIRDSENFVTIFNADNDFVRLLEQTDYSYTIESNRDDSDYIYSIEGLKNLKGRKFHKKKNLINTFMLHNNKWSFRTYMEEDFKLVLSFLEYWYEDKKNDENLMWEWDGIIQALLSYKYLNFEGGLLFVNDKLVGFTMVEMITVDTLVVHIEKANIEFIGAYSMLQFQMLQRYDDNVKWVNREQDIGIKNLRKAKKSYNPICFEHKYRVIIKK